jgi:ketosteroid isomerase-like protein
MIRTLMIAACVLIAAATIDLAVAFTACSDEQANSANRITLEKLYDQMNQALANQDVDKYLSFMNSEGYAFVDTKGNRVPFAEYSASARKTLARKRNENMMTKIKDVQVESGKMVAYIEEEGQLEINDEKNGWMPIDVSQTSEETWEMRNGEWKLVLSKTLRVRQSINAKWLAAQQKIKDLWYDAARSAIYSCNYSINGCR